MRRYAGYFDKLASVTDLTVEPGAEKPRASASVVVGRCEVFVPLVGMIDLEQERERLRGEIEEKEDFLKSVEQKLNNKQFVTKAPRRGGGARAAEEERRHRGAGAAAGQPGGPGGGVAPGGNA
jgi:valyl-tRNA synthetase (EC 6.1.1.9)